MIATWPIRLLFACLCAVQVYTGYAQQTILQYLSGTGPDNAVPWEFYCTEGRNSGKWTTIPVPSNWEFHGFGKFNYGHDKDKGKEEGWYRHRFMLAENTKNKRVTIVFEGSMTDTYVTVNGQPAGPVHQGAFYRFQYDITTLVKPGKENLLEVKVKKHSADTSVNRAEREADYWIFGGIYRPVYLAITPMQHIRRTAIDARADGSFRMHVFTGPAAHGLRVRASVFNLQGKPVASPFAAALMAQDTLAEIKGKVAGPALWNAEQPNLYQVKVDLIQANGEVLHTVTERFGFRTVEVRAGDGIYINGAKVIMKGVNRHCTWPTTGKALTRSQSLQDALLIKEMNMNAVRMSHYPPDKHFLEIADSLGLYVLNELSGWQKAYDTAVGRKLVKELVTRDVNHPCIILWANGNEGGFNRGLIPDYAVWDIQQREVYLPWERFGKFETKHYPDFNYVSNSTLYDKAIFMPTEFMHGLYDGGHGAGLEDFWNAMMQKPNCAGGFLWVFADEGIVRNDLNDSLDAKGNQGADGIVGPFRQKEASFYTIKQLWSPVQVKTPALNASFDGKLLVSNRYHFTNLQACKLQWKLVTLAGASRMGNVPATHMAPGESRWVALTLPANWRSYDVLHLEARDPMGKELFTWSWPIVSAPEFAQTQVKPNPKSEDIEINWQQGKLVISQGNVLFHFDTAHGHLSGITKDKMQIPLTNGPALAGASLSLTRFTHGKIAGGYEVKALYSGDATLEIRWLFTPHNPVQLKYQYVQAGESDFRGITFRFPEQYIQAVDWVGNGPYRVWKNRMQGGAFGNWHKDYNNTITGESWSYPEFKGYYANVYKTTFHTAMGTFSVIAGSESYFLQLLKPQPPRGAYNTNTAPAFPDGDLGFLQAISPIGTKFQAANLMGPQSQKNIMLGTAPLPSWKRDVPNKLIHYTPAEGILWFDFR